MISTFTFTSLFFLAVSTQAYDTNGISDYCRKSQVTNSIFQAIWYPPTPIECCDARGQCNQWIEPGGTNYGLTNPDTKWSRRSCDCDRKLYDCVTKNLSSQMIIWAQKYSFFDEICFRNVSKIINGKMYEQPEFIQLLHTVPSFLIREEIERSMSTRI